MVIQSVDPRLKLIQEIKLVFPGIVRYDSIIPSPYIGSSKIRAIILGTNPSDAHGTTFDYVFGLENDDSPYFRFISSKLSRLNLSMNDIYVQNLVQCYMTSQTSKNKHWNKIAEKWVLCLKNEIDQITDSRIPVIITADCLLKVLVTNTTLSKVSPHEIYATGRFINAHENQLNRKLIAIYRHPKYDLYRKCWGQYLYSINKFLLDNLKHP